MKGKENMNKLIQLFGVLIIIGSIGITTDMINPSEKKPEIPNLDFNPETSDVETISSDLSDSDITSILGEEGIEAINVIMQKANEILKTNNMQIEEETIKTKEVTNYKTIIRDLYLAIIIVRYGGPFSALTIALLRGLYLAIIMVRFEGPLSALTIAFHRGIYVAIIMARYGGPKSALTIALHRGLYLAIIMDRYRRPQSDLTKALHRGIYLAIILDRYGGTQGALTIALRSGLYVPTIMCRYVEPQGALTITLHRGL
jgi:hypothetical protein